MNYQFTVDLNDLPQRQPVKKTLGEVEVLLIREGDNVRAYQAKCPHAGAPLEQGAICGDGWSVRGTKPRLIWPVEKCVNRWR